MESGPQESRILTEESSHVQEDRLSMCVCVHESVSEFVQRQESKVQRSRRENKGHMTQAAPTSRKCTRTVTNVRVYGQNKRVF
jgi:hypothetical protein